MPWYETMLQGVQGRLVEERPPDASLLQVWAGPLSGGRVAVVFWNRGNDTQEILGAAECTPVLDSLTTGRHPHPRTLPLLSEFGVHIARSFC